MDTQELLTGCENCKMHDDEDINIFCEKCELKYLAGDYAYDDNMNIETFTDQTKTDSTSNRAFVTPRSNAPFSFTTSTDCRNESTGINRNVTSSSGNDTEKDISEDDYYKTSRHHCINIRFKDFLAQKTNPLANRAMNGKEILFREQGGDPCPSCQTRIIKEPITSLCTICFDNLCSGRKHKMIMRLKSM